MSYGEAGLEAREAPRVLLFSIDDAFFGLHLDWVEAVYPREAAPLNTVKLAGGGAQEFLLHRGEPAFRVELRDACELSSPGDRVARPAVLVVRSGNHLLALEIDACIGVRDLALHAQTPIPTRLVRDGGMPFGHLVELDGNIVVVVDPSRILDGAAREVLAGAVREAGAFQERARSIEALWSEIRREASLASLRKYARLCSRNGQSRRARAARLLVKHWHEAGDGASSNGTERAHDPTLIAELVRLSLARRSCMLVLEGADGAVAGVLVFRDGRLISASCGPARGLPALAQLLAMRDLRHRTSEAPGAWVQEQMTDDTPASAIDALASRDAERPRRHSA